MLRYAREDVRHTALLYQACLAELREHEGVDLQPAQLYSPAGVGAAYLQAMNVTPPLDKFTDLDPHLLGWAMSAFFGGRAEARIVRTPVPVVVADFTSMYPAQNALLDTWPVLTAAALTVDDVTGHVRKLVTQDDLTGRLFDAEMWRRDIGITLVQLDKPDGVILPVRAGYEPGARDYGIGINPLSYDGQLWYALPDVLAAAVLGDADIPVVRALRLRPKGRQRGLRPVMLRGHRRVDPKERANPFVAMIEERHRVKHDESLPKEERKRLDLFLKITANATAYGSLARFDRRDLADPVDVNVYGPADDSFPDKTPYPEDPGPYCFPPVAASITAGARLMLALIERTLRDAGGSYAFMDTDSIAVVATENGGSVPCATATGDTVNALSHAAVRGLLRRFDTLNPYGPDVVNDDPELGRSPWKVEHKSLARPVYCYAIATKRYALFEPDADGRPRLIAVTDAPEEAGAGSEAADTAEASSYIDWSEHGLGMYLDPSGRPPKKARDKDGHRYWIREAWQAVLDDALSDMPAEAPPWASGYAVSQFSVSSPRQANWFQLDEQGGHQAGRPRPFGFGILARAHPLAGGTEPPRPAARYEREPDRWPQLPWYDRYTTRTIRAVSSAGLADDPHRLADAIGGGAVPIISIGDALRDYGHRPEHKSLASNTQPPDGGTAGLLLRRPIVSAPVLTALIGKEGNRLLERATGEIDNPDDYRTHYGDADTIRWKLLVLPVLDEIRQLPGMTTAKLAADLGVSDRTIRNWLNAGETPHAGATRHRQRADRYAADWAASQLRAAGLPVPPESSAVLYAFLRFLLIDL